MGIYGSQDLGAHKEKGGVAGVPHRAKPKGVRPKSCIRHSMGSEGRREAWEGGNGAGRCYAWAGRAIACRAALHASGKARCANRGWNCFAVGTPYAPPAKRMPFPMMQCLFHISKPSNDSLFPGQNKSSSFDKNLLQCFWKMIFSRCASQRKQNA